MILWLFHILKALTVNTNSAFIYRTCRALPCRFVAIIRRKTKLTLVVAFAVHIVRLFDNGHRQCSPKWNVQRGKLALFLTIISLGVTRGYDLCSWLFHGNGQVSVLHRFMFVDEAPIVHDTDNRRTVEAGVLFRLFLAYYYALQILITMCILRILASGTFCLLAGAASQRNNVETSNFAIYSLQPCFSKFSLHSTTHAQRTFLWFGGGGEGLSQKLYVVFVSF